MDGWMDRWVGGWDGMKICHIPVTVMYVVYLTGYLLLPAYGTYYQQ